MHPRARALHPVSALLFACNGALKRIDKSNPTNVCIVRGENVRVLAHPHIMEMDAVDAAPSEMKFSDYHLIFVPFALCASSIRFPFSPVSICLCLFLLSPLPCPVLSPLKAHSKYEPLFSALPEWYIFVSAPAFCPI